MVAPLVAAAARTAAKAAAKKAATKKTVAKSAAKKVAKTSDKYEKSRVVSRQVDKVRKRYKRKVASYEKRIAGGVSGEELESLQKKLQSAKNAIEDLRYNREKSQYFGTSDVEEQKRIIRAKDIETSRESVNAYNRLKMLGKAKEFYAGSVQLWQGKIKDVQGIDKRRAINEAVISSLNEMGYDVKTLQDAIDVIEDIANVDLHTSKSDDGEEWERYKVISRRITLSITQERKRRTGARISATSGEERIDKLMK